MPGDLNLKKSWHPGLIKNQKKLWEQEQEALNEYLKIQAKNEELKKEKEKQELIKLQYGHSEDIPVEVKRELNNLSWMYNDSKNEKSNNGFNEVDDEFLLGKKKVESMLSGNKYIETKEISRFEETISTSRNKGNTVENDPLLKIKNEQLKKYQLSKDSIRHSSDGSHISSSTHKFGDRHKSRDRHKLRDRSPRRTPSHRSENDRVSKHRHSKSKYSGLKESRLKPMYDSPRDRGTDKLELNKNGNELKLYKDGSEHNTMKY